MITSLDNILLFVLFCELVDELLIEGGSVVMVDCTPDMILLDIGAYILCDIDILETKNM